MPVHVDRFVRRAWQRGADQITLDLEDSVPPHLKGEARTLLRQSIPVVAKGGASVSVRINRATWRVDIEAAVWPGVTGIVFPKAEDPGEVRSAGNLIDSLEQRRGIQPGNIRLLLLVETVNGLERAEALMSAHPRVAGVSGPAQADFTVDLGVLLDPTLDQLDWARGEMDLLLRRGGARGLGRWTSGQAITEYGDEERIRHAAEGSRRNGGRGGATIHPSSLAPLNAGYTPTDEEMQEAEELVRAVEEALAQGRAAAEVRGRIVTTRLAEAAKEYLRYGLACREADRRWARLMEAVQQEDEDAR